MLRKPGLGRSRSKPASAKAINAHDNPSALGSHENTISSETLSSITERYDLVYEPDLRSHTPPEQDEFETSTGVAEAESREVGQRIDAEDGNDHEHSTWLPGSSPACECVPRDRNASCEQLERPSGGAFPTAELEDADVSVHGTEVDWVKRERRATTSMGFSRSRDGLEDGGTGGGSRGPFVNLPVLSTSLDDNQGVRLSQKSRRIEQQREVLAQ